MKHSKETQEVEHNTIAVYYVSENDNQFKLHVSKGPFQQDKGFTQGSEKIDQSWKDDFEMLSQFRTKGSIHLNRLSSGDINFTKAHGVEECNAYRD
ncbi:hypothetical protein AYI69_g11306 [Smittium culicis]|uniref:Uncharacterized protein n=1 Tax=Smittium culicis TaxID=133412 RepID=A0A1R1WZN7_9FUNG|nr:hypothetical protein AYI69_g11306 [Smittium culicis]